MSLMFESAVSVEPCHAWASPMLRLYWAIPSRSERIVIARLARMGSSEGFVMSLPDDIFRWVLERRLGVGGGGLSTPRGGVAVVVRGVISRRTLPRGWLRGWA